MSKKTKVLVNRNDEGPDVVKVEIPTYLNVLAGDINNFIKTYMGGSPEWDPELFSRLRNMHVAVRKRRAEFPFEYERKNWLESYDKFQFPTIPIFVPYDVKVEYQESPVTLLSSDWETIKKVVNSYRPRRGVIQIDDLYFDLSDDVTFRGFIITGMLLSLLLDRETYHRGFVEKPLDLKDVEEVGGYLLFLPNLNTAYLNKYYFDSVGGRKEDFKAGGAVRGLTGFRVKLSGHELSFTLLSSNDFKFISFIPIKTKGSTLNKSRSELDPESER